MELFMSFYSNYIHANPNPQSNQVVDVITREREGRKLTNSSSYFNEKNYNHEGN